MHERPIMQTTIDDLIEKGHITPHNIESEWLSKPVLAQKPHHEIITSDKIDKFIQRFCISCISLHQDT